MGSVSEEVLLARAFLSRIAEPACIPLWDLVRTVGPLEAVSRIRWGQASDDVLRATQVRLAHVDPHADLEAAERYGIRLVVPESDEWPHFALSALERTGADRVARYNRGERRHEEHGEPIPPLALWVKGPLELASLAVRSVGIVGSRAATAYGEKVAADLGYGLARRGFVVVSGGAYGIDASAHRAALAAGGATVVVSAGGLDQPYPPSSATLFDRAAGTGLTLSESPPGAAPRRRRFLTRNRLIAALSTGTVLVEAAKRSGALNTTGHCARLGRPVLVVPGPVTSAMSAGCHTLLAADERTAHLVTGVDDVVSVIGGAGDVSSDSPSDSPSTAPTEQLRDTLDSLDERARMVFDGFPPRRVAHPEEIAVAAGLPPLEVIRALPELELSGLIESTADGYRIARPTSRTRS